MAEKSSEEYPCDNSDNISETTTSSNNTADKNSEDISGAICTTFTNPELMPEIFCSFDEPSSELNAVQLSMKTIVGNFFDEMRNKTRNNDNDNENVNENNPIDLVDINVDVNNEPNVPDAVDADIPQNMLATFESNLAIQDTEPRLSNFFDTYQNYPELFFLFDNFKCFTPPLPLSITLTPPLNFDVHFVKQGQQYIDFMSVFTEHDFCKPFLEKIFSYLTYKDIASMTTVSKNWRNAVLKSVNAQKELEKVFIHAILYFSHKNADVTDEYKQLFDKILIHFKNQIQFKKNDF